MRTKLWLRYLFRLRDKELQPWYWANEGLVQGHNNLIYMQPALTKFIILFPTDRRPSSKKVKYPTKLFESFSTKALKFYFCKQLMVSWNQTNSGLCTNCLAVFAQTIAVISVIIGSTYKRGKRINSALYWLFSSICMPWSRDEFLTADSTAITANFSTFCSLQFFCILFSAIRCSSCSSPFLRIQSRLATSPSPGNHFTSHQLMFRWVCLHIC